MKYLALVVVLALHANVSAGATHDVQVKRMLTDGQHHASVAVEKDTGKVEVDLEDESPYAPPSVSLTYKDAQSHSHTMTLRTLQTAPGSTHVYTGNLPAPQSQAQLGPQSQSFIGFELKIPWSSGESSTLQ
jgi:hypothetical protein